MWNITKTFLNPEESKDIIRVDPSWGFSEFPQPGDVKKHSLPVLVDYDELNKQQISNNDDNNKEKAPDTKEFWMPDRFCKVCYGCEEAFTMYRRRHHCRMCGQIFCNNCSSFYIDGMLFNIPGLVRACRLCYDQLFERTETENRMARRKLLEKITPAGVDVDSGHSLVRAAQSISAVNANKHHEHFDDLDNTSASLQSRASSHFVAIVERLVASSIIVNNRDLWKETISTLVREVVSCVDPDVRGGDGMDIRQYVKIKVIPGGSMDENLFIDGVVFRKNVSHKKMASSGTKTNPRILLLAGGIEFQRTDTKLSSMDTLIEQEDKYMEILVDKIMSLKPDIILVGKAVARRAQELLCEHKVVVMQNVKPQLLERIARMTGAMLLPSTDHMIKQFGQECMGTCGQFWLRVVQDDPEKNLPSQNTPRILRTRISRGSTYAYVTGCPSEKGCTIVLRGDSREVLSEVKRIIEFSMVVAYHLRLEVTYYNDRCADLPAALREHSELFDDGSDVDDKVVDEAMESTGSPRTAANKRLYGHVKVREERFFLSTSLDVDISLPYSQELVGTHLFHQHSKPSGLTISTAEQHQTLLITSLLMSEGASVPVQKASAEVKGIKYYTKQDIALGQFIIDNCFQLTRYVNRGESRMLDQTLSFIHRTGRIDISVHRHETAVERALIEEGTNHSQRDPLRLPIFMSSFCKECRHTVTPLRMMSEETWKMSFGKFLEMTFYNRTATCRVGGCSHSIRDNHTLSFQCEGYVAIFDFIPLHAFALHVREGMEFPEDFHNHHTALMLRTLPHKHTVLMEDFKMAIIVLEREIREMLANRPEDLTLAMTDITLMEAEIQNYCLSFNEELLATFLQLPKKFQDAETEAQLRLQIGDKSGVIVSNVSNKRISTIQSLQSAVGEDGQVTEVSVVTDDLPIGEVVSAQSLAVDQATNAAEQFRASESVRESIAGMERISIATAITPHPPLDANASPVSQVRATMRSASDYNGSTALSFPMFHFRDTFVKASKWNARIDTIYRFLESVRHMLIQQQQVQAQNPGADVFSYEEEYNEARRPLETLYALNHQQQHISAAFAVSTANSVAEPSFPLTPMNEDSPPPPPHQNRDGSFSDPLNMHNIYPNSGSGSIYQQSMDVVTGGVLLSKTVNETKKQAEKPVDKMSRITKVISRFLVMGNKETAEEHGKFLVPLGDFGEGRYGLQPGRRGEVIPVHEDEFATIIAYTLASAEYYDGLQLSLREDNIDNPDYDASTANFNAADHDPRKKHSDDPLRSNTSFNSSSVRSGQTGTSAKTQSSSVATAQHQQQHEEDNDIDDDNDMLGGGASTRSNDTSGKLVVGVEASEVERAFATVVKDSQVITSANLFSGTGGSDHLFNKEEHQQQQQAGNDGANLPQEGEGDDPQSAKSQSSSRSHEFPAGKSTNEKQMISQNKSYIRHRFNDVDEDGNVTCKFQCQVYWAKQFEAVRACYFKESDNENFIRSLSMSSRWSAQGGKSGAAFSKSMDDRLVIKVISRVELQMFLEFAPAYFEYMAKAYYHSLPTVLCKILGVYTVRYHNKESGKKVVENVVVMENIFYQRNITRTFDLKGSSRARYVDLAGQKGDDFDEALLKRRKGRRNRNEKSSEATPASVSQVLLDDNLMELTRGRPFPLKHRAKLFFHKAVLNDTLFLSIVNVVDYSILVGFDETSHEIVVGIIDYMRQYDIIKKMERMGKSVGMLTGQAEPTIIQPSQYRKRFSLAMERYFMTVPDKWVSHDG